MKCYNTLLLKHLFLLFPVFILLLSNCTNEEEVPPNEEEENIIHNDVILMAVNPEVAEKPNDGELENEIDDLYFPSEGLSNKRVSAYGVTDYVDFNDPMALTIIPNNAKNTFTYWPYYIQQVGNAWVHVKENNGTNYRPAFRSDYQHYHLGYEHFVPCNLGGSIGDFGKPNGGNCMPFNPIYEHRVLSTHYGDHWIKIYAYDYDSPSRVFDLLEIEVVNGPIKLYFKKAGGGWYHWSSLGEGRWNLSNYCTGINQVLISGTSSASVSFDDLKIKVPY